MSGYGESERTGGVEVGPEIGTHASTAPAHQPLPPPPTTHHPPPPLLLRGCSLLSCNIHTILNQTFSLLTSHFSLLTSIQARYRPTPFSLLSFWSCGLRHHSQTSTLCQSASHQTPTRHSITIPTLPFHPLLPNSTAPKQPHLSCWLVHLVR